MLLTVVKGRTGLAANGDILIKEARIQYCYKVRTHAIQRTARRRSSHAVHVSSAGRMMKA